MICLFMIILKMHDGQKLFPLVFSLKNAVAKKLFTDNNVPQPLAASRELAYRPNSFLRKLPPLRIAIPAGRMSSLV